MKKRVIGRDSQALARSPRSLAWTADTCRGGFIWLTSIRTQEARTARARVAGHTGTANRANHACCRDVGGRAWRTDFADATRRIPDLCLWQAANILPDDNEPVNRAYNISEAPTLGFIACR